MKKLFQKLPIFFSVLLNALCMLHYESKAAISIGTQMFQTPIDLGYVNFNAQYSGNIKQVGFRTNLGPIFWLETTSGEKYYLEGIDGSIADSAVIFTNTNGAYTKGASKSATGHQDGKLYIFSIASSSNAFMNTQGFPGGNFGTVGTVTGTGLVGDLSELTGWLNWNTEAAGASYGYYFRGTNATGLPQWCASSNGSVTTGACVPTNAPTVLNNGSGNTPTPTPNPNDRGSGSGLPTWAWIAIGVVVFLILVFVVMSFVTTKGK